MVKFHDRRVVWILSMFLVPLLDQARGIGVQTWHIVLVESSWNRLGRSFGKNLTPYFFALGAEERKRESGELSFSEALEFGPIGLAKACKRTRDASRREILFKVERRREMIGVECDGGHPVKGEGDVGRGGGER